MDFESWLRAKRKALKEQVDSVAREIAAFEIQLGKARDRSNTLQGAYVALVEAERQLLSDGVAELDEYLR